MNTGKVFSGLRVLDVGSYVAAPAAARVLSDFGATVIKIEPPGTGDAYRHSIKRPGIPRSEHNYYWTAVSRNKFSLALDLKAPEGRAVLHRLAASADVLVTNLPPRSRARLGLDYDALAALNQRLIYASLTGYGETGAEADKAGFDTTAWWARSGLMDSLRPSIDSAPALTMPAIGDYSTALALYGAIVTALYRRERTGKGGYVGTSLLAAGAWTNAAQAQAALSGAEFVESPPRERTANALSNCYRAADGRWFILHINTHQELTRWPVFCNNIGRPDLIADARFANLAERQANTPALIAILDALFAERPAAEWECRLEEGGFAVSVATRCRDLASDRQMRDAGAFVPMPEAGGTGMTVSSPLWLGDEEKAAPMAAPALGEHTDQVLRDNGFSDSEIAILRTNKVVC